jgi:hypothetical protein
MSVVEKSKEEFEGLSTLISEVEASCEKYIKDRFTAVVPDASTKVLMPVVSYCLRAPIIVGFGYSKDKYLDEVLKCITTYNSKALELYREVIVPKVNELWGKKPKEEEEK